MSGFPRVVPFEEMAKKHLEYLRKIYTPDVCNKMIEKGDKIYLGGNYFEKKML